MEPSVFKRAILHLSDLGDTDILPPLFEFNFYREECDKIVAKMTTFSAAEYNPVGVFEVLTPKTQTSFRIAHQLYATDSLLYTAAAINIAPLIESKRKDQYQGAYSYRFNPDKDSPSLFQDGCSFHDWMYWLTALAQDEDPFKSEKLIIETDVSDFYGRIYFHRIEHVLDEIEADNKSRKIIEIIIKNTRARQSYGLPVGSAASRIIAEGVLIDTDTLISNSGIEFSRYVDDIRIFVRTRAEAFSMLCKLAEHLMITEGLSLNAAKTKISTASDLIANVEEKFSEVFDEKERKALDSYLQAIYDSEDIETSLADAIDTDTLISKLEKLLRTEVIDYTSAKLILKALRATGVPDPIGFVEKTRQLLYFIPRDYCLLVGSLSQRNPETSDKIADLLIRISQQEPFVELALVRIWVKHLFVGGALPLTQQALTELSRGDTPIEKRQILLMRGRLEEKAFFRAAKTKWADYSDWEKPALMLAASCLPASEYEAWLSFCKGKINDFLGDEYIAWLKKKGRSAIDNLNQDFRIETYRQSLIRRINDDDFPTDIELR